MTNEITVVGGVDTHTDVHQAAGEDSIGRRLATKAFPTDPAGCRRLLERLRSQGESAAVGVEGTGAYGAELARVPKANRITVVEVDRPTAGPVAPTASPTRSTPTPPPPRSCPDAPPASPRPATASSRPSAPCAWSAAPRSSPAHRRRIRSTTSSSPRPETCANNSADHPGKR
nr:transposase [Embleya hyalina]